jgi:hypothetical protein
MFHKGKPLRSGAHSPHRHPRRLGAWIAIRPHRLPLPPRRADRASARAGEGAPGAEWAQTSEVRVEATIRAVKLEPLSPFSAIAAK